MNPINFVPKQPFMVKVSLNYYKYVFGRYGISHFYSFKVEDHVDKFEISVPDGCIDFNISYTADGEYVGANFYGTDLSPHAMKCYKNCHYFGMRFLPGCTPVFANISMAEMIDKMVPYEEVALIEDLPQLIVQKKDFMAQIQCFLKQYMRFYNDKTSSKEILMSGLIKEIIVNYGNISVGQLSEETNYSISYLDKMFKNEIGISPKKFSNIIRFQYLLNRISCGADIFEEMNINSLMLNLGYYDQAHMIHDFKKFANLTPNQYVVELYNMNYNQRLKIIDKKP